jgi:hypothetical protein
MGRHIIGYEVQKVLSAVDWFKQTSGEDLRIGVAGYGEGGLIAFYAAAVDKRIDAALVSGYFNSRQDVWDEPIYRNVWGLLTEFGDAEIASLIAPRPLVIENSSAPELVDKMKLTGDKLQEMEGLPFTGYKGRLGTPPFKDVQAEFARIELLTKPGFQQKALITGEQNKPVSFGSQAALKKFVELLGARSFQPAGNEIPVETRKSFDPAERQIHQVKEIEDHVQWLLRDSEYARFCKTNLEHTTLSSLFFA